MGTLPPNPPFLLPTTSQPVVKQQYVPPNWSNLKPSLYAITFASQGSIQQGAFNSFGSETESSELLIANTNDAKAGYNATLQMNMFVFDAIKRAQHRQTAVITQHPLQTGFNISDHVVMQPAQLVLEVAMSDAIASFTLAGYTPMWTSNPSKSVSAYQQMEALMVNRQLMTINTRLDTYSNMILADITSEDTERTYFGGLAMVLSFQQVFIADVSLSYESSRPQASGDTQKGAVQPLPPSKPVVDQHLVTELKQKLAVSTVLQTYDPLSPLRLPGAVADIPGAGTYTSEILKSNP
jgi:hypothetical protein